MAPMSSPEHPWIPAEEIKRVIDMPFRLDHALQQLGGAKKGACRIVERSSGERSLEVPQYIVQALLDRGVLQFKPRRETSVGSARDPLAFAEKYGIRANAEEKRA